MTMEDIQKINQKLYTLSTYKFLVGLGIYKDHKWAVVAGAGYPQVYVENKNHIMAEYIEFHSKIVPHGGITYSGPAFWNCEDDSSYIGWDYGHITMGDFVNMNTSTLETLGKSSSIKDYTFGRYDLIKKEIFDIIDRLIVEERHDN